MEWWQCWERERLTRSQEHRSSRELRRVSNGGGGRVFQGFSTVANKSLAGEQDVVYASD